MFVKSNTIVIILSHINIPKQHIIYSFYLNKTNNNCSQLLKSSFGRVIPQTTLQEKTLKGKSTRLW